LKEVCLDIGSWALAGKPRLRPRSTAWRIHRGSATDPLLRREVRSSMSLPLAPVPLAEALRAAARLGAPLAHFGQTVFWDEPTKALLFTAMKAAGLRIPVVAGVHDTDYFSKLPATSEFAGPAAILPANDGGTRDLWASAGECAVPFGCEHRVTLRTLTRHGVPVRRLAKQHPSGPAAFVDLLTEAYGWRGLALIGGADVTCRDVRTGDVGPHLRGLVEWALQQSLRMIADDPTRVVAERYASRMLKRLDLAISLHEHESLSECFRTVLRHLIGQLAGEDPDNLTVTSSSAHMRFGRSTAGLRRFAPLDIFLDRATREAACAAYDEAVTHTGIYALEEFGEGALPFDLVVPGRGRGTLRCSAADALLDLPEGTVTLGSSRGLRDRHGLAALVERRLGPGCALVGKALVFPMMLLSEAVMVLADTGSPYITTGTRALVEGLARRGIRPALYPLLRLRYHALDALSALDSEFCLPEHLAGAFGKQRVSAAEIAEGWQGVVDRERSLLGDLAASQGAGVVLRILAEESPEHRERLERYDCLHCRMRQHGRQMAEMTGALKALAVEAAQVAERARELERKSGKLRREWLKPLWSELDGAPPGDRRERMEREIEEVRARRSAIQQEIAAIRAQGTRLAHEWRELRARLRSQQRSGVAAVVHEELHSIEDQTAWDRLRLVRRARLTVDLEAADKRPTAWWFPFLGRGPSGGAWYAEVSRRCEAYFEVIGDGLPLFPGSGGEGPG